MPENSPKQVGSWGRNGCSSLSSHLCSPLGLSLVHCICKPEGQVPQGHLLGDSRTEDGSDGIGEYPAHVVPMSSRGVAGAGGAGRLC